MERRMKNKTDISKSENALSPKLPSENTGQNFLNGKAAAALSAIITFAMAGPGISTPVEAKTIAERLQVVHQAVQKGHIGVQIDSKGPVNWDGGDWDSAPKFDSGPDPADPVRPVFK